MLSRSNNLAIATPRRGALWLAVLAMGWLQLSAAAHQFDHVAQQIGESCQVCVQFDRADDAAANHSTASAVVAFSDTPVCQASASDADTTRTLGFDSRAPPRL